MATIANLQIDLSARTARFSEGLQRAQQRVQQFSRRVQVDFQRVTQVGQRASLVFSGMTAGLTLLTRKAGQYAAQIKDAADQTGLTYRSMQELSYAASQSAADFQTLMSGLRAFVRRTAEAAAGNTSFLKGFERLGFTQEEVRAGLQDLDGFLMQVADRVAELGTTAEQSAVLMTIMGDAGRRLVPFMAQGARGIRELREQAQELGLVMDEQAVRRLDAFNSRMEVLQERTSAARREIAVWFLPVMEAGVGLFEDLTGAIQDIDPALRAHAVRWTVVVGAVLGAVGVLGVLGTAVSQAGALLGAFGRLLGLVFSPIVIYSALAIGAIALFRAAWEKDWLSIRTVATNAWDNYIKPIWDILGEAWEWAINIAGTAWDWLTDTTWAEKVEDIKGWLTGGWEWLVNIAGSAWDWLVNTTWAEKIEDVRGWLDSAWNWTINLLGDAWAWIEEHLPWLAATIETLAGWLSDAWIWTLERAGDAWDWLDQHAPAVTETIRNLRDWLSDAWDWTINTVGTAWEWLRHLEWIDAIERVKQALSSAWNWTINRVGGAWGWLTNVPRGLGLPGYQSGTPWTGWGSTDEVAGVVHRREAVIPWDVLRRGPAAVLEFLGAPGFQAGYIPAAFGGLTDAVVLVESAISSLESRGVIDPETAMGLRELTDNLLGIVGSLYDRARELWDQLGQVDLDEYIDQARRFRDELEALGDVAEQERLAILARIERLDELVEIERLMAEATGQAFNEAAFRAQELSLAIVQTARTMFEAGESVEAIAEAIAPWVEQLEPLQRQIRLQNAAGTALERLAARLSEVDAVLAALVRSLRWEAGRGFRIDTDNLTQAAIELAVDFIFDLLSEQASATRALRNASEALQRVAEEWREFISSAPLHELFAELEGIERRRQAEQERLDWLRERLPFGLGDLLPDATGVAVPPELEQARQRIEDEIRKIEKWGVWPWERSRYEQLKDALREIDRQIREFQESAAGELEERIREALGVGWRELASGVRSAFQAENLEDFTSFIERELKTRVRDAMITAFLESATMAPLFQELSDRIFAAVRDGVVTAGELDAIEDVISQITDKSAAFFEVLDELGLAMEDLAGTTKDVNRSLRNIPIGYRVERALFEVSPPRLPALATVGIVTRPTLALGGEDGPEAVVPLDGRGFGTVSITIERMEVQDGRDFGRRLDEELRRRGLVRAGNVTAWGGRR